MDLSLGFNLVPMINVSDFVPIIFCFYYHSSVDQLEIENRNIFCSCFLILDYFGYAELFFFHMKMSFVFSRSVKTYVGNLIGIVLTLQITFGRIMILTMLILLMALPSTGP